MCAHHLAFLEIINMYYHFFTLHHITLLQSCHNLSTAVHVVRPTCIQHYFEYHKVKTKEVQCSEYTLKCKCVCIYLLYIHVFVVFEPAITIYSVCMQVLGLFMCSMLAQ